MKQVPFTGIVRNLPAISVPDGSAHEVINLRPKDGAWRPVGSKKRILNFSQLSDLRFIHDISSTIRGYIGVVDGYISYYYQVEGFSPSGIFETSVKCNDNTVFAAWHNVVMVSDGDNEVTTLLLFRESDMQYLAHGILSGTFIPDLPVITFERIAGETDSDEATYGGDLSDEAFLDAQIAEWAKMMNSKAEIGYISGQVLVRTAWELADGTIVKQSIPDMIWTSDITQSAAPSTGTVVTNFTGYYLRYKLNCNESYLNAIQSEYRNVIRSLNIYISLPRGLKKVQVPNSDFYSPYKDVPDVENETYFLLLSIPLDRIQLNPVLNLHEEGELDLGDLTDIATRAQMPIINQNHHGIFGRRLFVYNDRIFMADIKNYLYRNKFIQGWINEGPDNATGADYSVGIEFDVFVASKRVVTVFTGWTTANFYNASTGNIEFFLRYWADYTGWGTIHESYIGYPDSRAQVARVFVSTDGGTNVKLVATFNLKPVIDQNFSYAKGTMISGSLGSFPTEWLVPGDINYYYDTNRIQACEINNPFFYPAINSYRVQGDVLGMATNAIALSQGQFGQFPVIVWTSEGMWTLSIGSGELLINTITPMGRHVCNNPGNILPIDGGIIFTTDKGLFVVSGAQVIELSTPVEGNYTNSLHELGAFHASINNPNLFQVDDLLCTKSFLDYTSAAIMAWDYANREIIVCNPSEKYSWVYSVDAKVWTKIGQVWDRFISIYPVTYGLKLGTPLQCYDLTEETFTDRVPVMIETRPMKLDPTTYKKIKRILIEGFNNQLGESPFSVHLYGSVDGVRWYHVSHGYFMTGQDMVIGGGSFSCKYFTLVIGGRVDEHSYTQGALIDYQGRYNDKLR